MATSSESTRGASSSCSKLLTNPKSQSLTKSEELYFNSWSWVVCCWFWYRGGSAVRSGGTWVLCRVDKWWSGYVNFQGCFNCISDDLPYDWVQISLHKLENEVEITAVVGFYRPLQFYDVCVLKLMQDWDLPIGSLGIDVVLKGIKDFLQSVFAVCLSMYDLPDMSVGATP